MPGYNPREAKEWAKEHVRGIYVALTTPERCSPSTGGFELDEEGLRHDVEHYLTVNKVSGFFLFGMFGNFYNFSVEERMRATEIIVEVNRGRVPLVCNCEHATVAETLRLIDHATAVGVDMISLTGPRYAGNASAVGPLALEYFTYVAARAPIGLTIDNIDYTGYLLTPQRMASFARISNVGILKNVAPLAHTIELRSLVGEELQVIDPTEEHHMVNLLQFGQQATMDGNSMMYDAANGTPMKDYFDAALAGDARKSATLYYQMQPLRDVYERWVRQPWDAEGRIPLARVKCWSHLLGLTGGPTRPPIVPLTEAESAGIRADLEAIGKL